MEVVSGVNPTNVGFQEEKRDSLIKTTIGVGLSVAVLFATVWVVGRAWKQSQKA